MLDAVLQHGPDLVLVELSESDAAFAAIEAVMAQRPTPILIVREAAPGSEVAAFNTFRALALGALDVAERTSAAGEAFWNELARKVRLLAQVRVVRHVRGSRKHKAKVAERLEAGHFPVVAVAASLGGPRALSQ